MVSITACPQCSQDVTIPADLPGEASVRCPLCEAEFLLADIGGPKRVLIDTSEPPELELVEPATEETLTDGESPDDVEDDPDSTEEPIDAELAETEADDEEGVDADEMEDDEAPEEEKDSATDAPPSVRCPCCEAEFPLNTLIMAGTGNPISPEAVAAIASDGSASSDPRFDFEPPTDESSGSADGAFDFAAEDESSDDESPSLALAKGKRKKNEKSVARELLGVFAGGAFGLAIMYYALNFFGGEQFDMAKIYLPGVQHTAEHKPDWWPQWPQSNSDQEDSEPTDSNEPELDATAYGDGGGLV